MEHQVEKQWLRPWLQVLGLGLLCATAPVAHATEGGGSSYAVGVETNFTGLMLPEGTHFLLYYQHYAADQAKDDAGDDNARFAYFRTRADVVALRLSHVWPGVRVAGANLETRLALPLPQLDLDLGIARPAGLGTLDRSGSASGVGDLTLAPVLLGWHGLRLHQMAGLEVILPTGDYDRQKPVNLGRNTRQLAALYGLTWLPGKWESSARLRYAVNSRNAATDYRSGDELSLEFSAGYKFVPGWSAGLNGYAYRQLSDDRQAGSRVNGDGNRAVVNAIGPYIAWAPAPRYGLVAKWQIESGAHNRAEGQRFWLQGRYAF
jgi:hypothetical protein